jgi:DNA-binding FadR family transcriptional regulator
MVQEMINSQKLRAGDRLPSERELASLLGVNRATVRESIRILQQRGLVDMRIGSGTYVTQVPPHIVGQAIERYFASRECSQKDLQAVRTVIEPEIAALAATHASEDDLAHLGHLLNRLEKAWLAGDTDDLPDADANFHLGLAVASHNELFIAIVSGLSLIMKQWINTTHRLQRVADSHIQHRRVYEAVVARDPNRAREAMQVHMITTPMVEDETGD